MTNIEFPNQQPTENEPGVSHHLHASEEQAQIIGADKLKGPVDVAFLVVREGTSWRDVFRLSAGQVTTIGRAPTNRVVLRDEICSRNHCEVFQSGDRWTLRDLGSRNGTQVNGVNVVGDSELLEGDMIQIGPCDLGFTHDISKPFARFDANAEFESDTESAHELVFDHPSNEQEPEITHRRRMTRFRSQDHAEDHNRDRTSRELAMLYQLTIDMGIAESSKQLSEVVLQGLFAGTSADIGAVLLLQQAVSHAADTSDLRVIAYRSQEDRPYQKMSDYLSSVVLGEWEAVLARDIADDSRLASRDSLGEIHARSVICAPIRGNQQIHGLIHLYSTNPDNALDPDDLEFTLAVADQMAAMFGKLQERDQLAEGLARFKNEAKTLRKQLAMESEIIGDSPQVHKLRDEILKIAPSNATTLVRGESGVGKELVSRSIHFNSDRKDGPFVCMNCAALSESLLESELFGHEKGAFTGAVSRKMGKFEQADKGSLFLYEVGEMSLAVQAKFLRVLEGHPFERVGGSTPIYVDVRTIAATNRNLEQAIEEKSFRQDLYFRLHVVTIQLEPLRERKTDIPLLANYFLERIAMKTGKTVKRLSPVALNLLVGYPWPGNVRELQNVIERAVILCGSSQIGKEDIQLSNIGSQFSASRGHSGDESENYREVSLNILEKEHILATLERTNWNKTKASAILGIERSTLDRKLKRYQVSRPHG